MNLLSSFRVRVIDDLFVDDSAKEDTYCCLVSLTWPKWLSVITFSPYTSVNASMERVYVRIKCRY